MYQLKTNQKKSWCGNTNLRPNGISRCFTQGTLAPGDLYRDVHCSMVYNNDKFKRI